jgi:hypothetical protein
MRCAAGLLIDTQGFGQGYMWVPGQERPPKWKAVHAVTLGKDRLLPLRPVWPGFAVNTLFYAAVIWLLICGPFVLCRFIRVRRGLCPKCAYPVGTSDQCSECGKALPQRAVA